VDRGPAAVGAGAGTGRVPLRIRVSGPILADSQGRFVGSRQANPSRKGHKVRGSRSRQYVANEPSEVLAEKLFERSVWRP
jgi:hypothetical protein